jgi:hypothetical protein
MNATVVDLRYKTKEILKALDRQESVNILYHGKIKGVIRSIEKKSNKSVQEHAFFNLNPRVSVEKIMAELRGGRHRDL